MAEDILIPLGGMVLSGWITYTIIAGIQHWHQRRTQAIFQSKMLDKIGSISVVGADLQVGADDYALTRVRITVSPRRRKSRGPRCGRATNRDGLE